MTEYSYVNPTIQEAATLVRQIYRIVDRLEALFPGRHFTPDGHMVGSIGEVLAAARYGLELLPASAPLHDARAVDGKLVQVKATQSNRIAFRGEQGPEHLIVLSLNRDGTTTEEYNGPGHEPWSAAGRFRITARGRCHWHDFERSVRVPTPLGGYRKCP